MKKYNRIVIDPFCMRQFSSTNATFIDYNMFLFEKTANEHYLKGKLLDGYAPFCKHVFVQNFAKVAINVEEITTENQKFLKSTYEARTEKQLPVLRRYFPKEIIKSRQAKYLDLILYSKDQVQKQNESMGNIDPNKDLDYDFGIVSIKPSDVDYESPMDPITIMRNALGKQHGGSGVPLQREKYLESVTYWSKHAIIK